MVGHQNMTGAYIPAYPLTKNIVESTFKLFKLSLFIGSVLLRTFKTNLTQFIDNEIAMGNMQRQCLQKWGIPNDCLNFLGCGS